MNEKHYKLRFLPLFEEDLKEIVDYITHRLKNPIAAEALISDVQTAIRDRLFCAEAFEQYHSAKERQYPYYRITVRNYTIFYVVIDDVMEVRRIIYSRRDIKHQIRITGSGYYPPCTPPFQSHHPQPDRRRAAARCGLAAFL